ncbi:MULTISPECIES: glyoxylate/hydroxypyruvate reductase A [unclassified Chelatococcus]|uniref:2-hydroxyacid dehydrogenase n=1 Tax=unclassified Chelatococcus TaxID=2638111 RepID=UPI001BCE143E|nr:MULTISPECIES: glyoxylate/hydroxypyruvate reductase A [unclassified Chelatococcus]CAH1662986.1 D-3-phosphoglycerate dehydrogenase [Hyphomicrobiales bacterium]MBS7741511.1 glyoxylate/hydroxypyruvate reductase A [Chelatococcus sp. HY11]MBX3544470.1 glyoxylate/hydroxypyruvate reductase A [Chelatococcus sp.]MCO5079007.1 glyoxylate/hydroxypyruvate reductase A [Chelatococcus sp.]CAH1682439.1 D-3-phosphoglycerate dehydrogenase [Hyphomicrobiales bacterium]
MSLVIIRKTAPVATWLEALARECPDLDVCVWPETGPVADVEFVLTWAANRGVIASFPNLKGIFSLGAGVDHILSDPTVPVNLPVIRMIDPSLTRNMVQYVVLAALRHHRRWDEMAADQRRRRWGRPEVSPARIGILGMGELGQACARQFLSLGYAVSGWSRRGLPVEGVEVFSGDDGLAACLAQSDILVSLLPQTAATENLLDRARLSRLPRGAYLINAGRGEHLVDADLVALLDEGHLAGATLDVFRQEPLPPEHPFWTHPAVTVTPHAASWTVPATAAAQVAQAIEALRNGKPPRGLVDRTTGY